MTIDRWQVRTVAEGANPQQRPASVQRAPAVTSQHLSLMHLQSTAGNRAVAQFLSPAPVPAVQRRRVPEEGEVAPLVAAGATDQAAHVRGLNREIDRSLAQLSPTDQAAVQTAAVALAGGSGPFGLLSVADKARLVAKALRTKHPTLELGDPALIGTGPRPGTTDVVNLSLLVVNASLMISAVVAGARDADLQDVFGAASVGAAKANYAAAATRLNQLHALGRIVTDRSGYNAEAGIGGAANTGQISLEPNTIDNPNDHESVVTLIHESLHAGNGNVSDRGYIDSPSFTTLPAADKLLNAAHYEVAVRRHWKMADAHVGTVFIPAGTSVTVGGTTLSAPKLTPWEDACRQASEAVRGAWTVGLNLHNIWVRVNLNRADWSGLSLSTYGGATAARFSDCLPYWSKVQGLTVHERPGLSATGTTPDTAPVTQVDVSLSEGMVRLLVAAMQVASQEFATPGKTQAFLAARTTPAERAAASTVKAKTALLLTALRGVIGEITGTPARDVKVITAMAAASGSDWSKMLVPRSPGSFA
jgi:hypothetical protein